MTVRIIVTVADDEALDELLSRLEDIRDAGFSLAWKAEVTA